MVRAFHLSPLILYPGFVKKRLPAELKLHELPIALRKERDRTQQALAHLIERHISQIWRYESGQSQPTLEAIRKLAIPRSVRTDRLLFPRDQRRPGDDFRLPFEAASRLDPEEKNGLRPMLESILLRHTFKMAERRFPENGASNR